MRGDRVDIIEAVKSRAVPKMLADAILEVNMECECGETLEFDETMRKLRCSSENCLCALKGEAKRALRFLGATQDEVDDLDEVIKSVINEETKSGCEILLSENESIKGVINKYIEDEISLYDILGLTGIKLLTASSKSIMQGYRSVKELFDDLERNEAVVIVRRLRLEKSILLASKIVYDIERCRRVLLEVERRVNVRVVHDNTVRVAGNCFDETQYIGVPTDEAADLIAGSTGNKLYGTLVEEVSKKRVRKGLRALQSL